MTAPKGYEWLDRLGLLPRTIFEGLKLFGVQEIVGKGSNRTIISWRDELNHAGVKIVGFSDDDIPWCGLFAAIVAHRAEKVVPESPLWALNWLNFGKKVDTPALGDVIVFAREGGNHVAFYVAEDRDTYHVLGGNQSNRVSITRIPKYRARGYRRPGYMRAPDSVKPYKVAANGAISRNEA